MGTAMTRSDAERRPDSMSVTCQGHISVARERAKRFAENVGLARIAQYEVATCASELAANLVVHTSDGGTLGIEAALRDGEIGVRITSKDTGPGIPSLTDAFEDGFSTAGSMGSGLPTVRRLMDDFEVATTAGKGTRVVAVRWQRKAA